MKALIIDEPWMTEVLAGRKIWEMRRTRCHHRGPIALIRKGSGQVVGVADVVDSLSSIESAEAFAAAENRHRIPPDRQSAAFADGWRYPWVLRNARPLAEPVHYQHPKGAVIWVTLEADVAAQVAESCLLQTAGGDGETNHDSTQTSGSIAEQNSSRRVIETERPHMRVQGRIEGNRCIIPITEGNLKNNHVYLRSVLSFFPEDCIGGSDKSQLATRTLTLKLDGGASVVTDIAGPDAHGREGRSKHYFFRMARGRNLREFFERTNAQSGDEVVIECSAPYTYAMSLRKI
jgi:hypothetical protein